MHLHRTHKNVETLKGSVYTGCSENILQKILNMFKKNCRIKGDIKSFFEKFEI